MRDRRSHGGRRSPRSAARHVRRRRGRAPVLVERERPRAAAGRAGRGGRALGHGLPRRGPTLGERTLRRVLLADVPPLRARRRSRRRDETRWAQQAFVDTAGGWVQYRSNFASIELPRPSFDAYLRDEGPRAGRSEARSRLDPRPPGRERYRRCCKAWLDGRDERRATRPLGQPARAGATLAPAGRARAARPRAVAGPPARRRVGPDVVPAVRDRTGARGRCSSATPSRSRRSA
jgi:hypothetical protein